MNCVSVANGVCVLHMKPCYFLFTVLKSSTIHCYGLPSLYIVPYVVSMELIFTACLFATVFLHSNFPVFLEHKGLLMELIIIFTYLIGCFSYFIYKFLDILLLKLN